MSLAPAPPDGNRTYALVAYIPGPLGAFLDELRGDLNARQAAAGRAHVTLLSPRPLGGDPQSIAAMLRSRAKTMTAIEIEAGVVATFEATNVVYLEIGRGHEDLHQMHAAFSTNGARFQEPYKYHPHITLAIGLEAAEIEQVKRQAHHRWSGFQGDRRFLVRDLHLVENTIDNEWIEIACITLPVPGDTRADAERNRRD